jgi:hypothetical protein
MMHVILANRHENDVLNFFRYRWYDAQFFGFLFFTKP